MTTRQSAPRRASVGARFRSKLAATARLWDVFPRCLGFALCDMRVAGQGAAGRWNVWSVKEEKR